MCGYGFIRFSLPMFPAASADLMSLVFALSMIAVVYTSLVALAQRDMKKLNAYSSVAHMAFVTVGTFGFTQQAIERSTVVMLSHGLVSAALFLCVGVVYDRLHTRGIDVYARVGDVLPRTALLFMLFTMTCVGLVAYAAVLLGRFLSSRSHPPDVDAVRGVICAVPPKWVLFMLCTIASVGRPGTGGFIGEFLVMRGVFGTATGAVAIIGTGIILGEDYMLYLYRRVVL